MITEDYRGNWPVREAWWKRDDVQVTCGAVLLCLLVVGVIFVFASESTPSPITIGLIGLGLIVVAVGVFLLWLVLCRR